MSKKPASDKEQNEELHEELKKFAWNRIQEALLTKKVEIPESEESSAQTLELEDEEYVKLLKWVAGYKPGGGRVHNFPLDGDKFKIPETE